ncbi:class I SAM-dependent methyltransferase [Paenibacillus aurantiacus]|uniref:Class I SAM-dependent methyltransferase n=1 Tax=Paenibacillus aurantiacus TaxID=1936118 RepID=A0ABV5KWM8_9BACL
MDITSFWSRVNPDLFLQNADEGYNKPIRQLYRSLLEQLKVNKMLEVGCGPGVDFLGAKTVNPNMDYTGVDITPQMIEHCRLKYPEGNFMEGNILNLPFADNSFEFVYCKDVLNHLDNWEAGFSELYRISGGFVLVNFFHGLGTTTFKKRELHEGYLNNIFDWNEVMTTLSAFNPVEMRIYPRLCLLEEALILFQKA